MHEHLSALAVKIAGVLSIKSEYLVTLPAELRILREMSDLDVSEFAKSRGWRVIRRLGGRQIEFYNDASQHPL
jgi:bifunctional DNA-binding transcriptional regulator/antitoxin component of YhaV-PrlF toxin-antitoxin module